MQRPLISNFLVLENTVARATCCGEHGFGQDDENISVSSGEDNDPGKYSPFKKVISFSCYFAKRKRSC